MASGCVDVSEISAEKHRSLAGKIVSYSKTHRSHYLIDFQPDEGELLKLSVTNREFEYLARGRERYPVIAFEYHFYEALKEHIDSLINQPVIAFIVDSFMVGLTTSVKLKI